MSVFNEIAVALEIKMKKYRNIKLSPEENIRLEDMLLSEAVNETIFSLKTMKIGVLWQRENMKNG